ncbi:MAG: hypothetical protein KJ634_03590 [Gammaproteobacteria bacterium]|nr:hypothetical protein [Gammaproteobacteria bacterium]MBU1414687.1 hypothetical protein [Gammaproteobacteria bacterium]
MKKGLLVLATALFALVSACGGGGSTSNSNDTGSLSGSTLPTELSGLASKFTFPAQDANGWSILTPSSDSRLIYVSTSGNDGTAQTYSTASAEVGADPYNPSGAILPYATIDAALGQARAGYPDYILLKRGETWTRTAMINMKAGRSATERSVLGYYGSAAARPTILHKGVNFSWASYSAVVGVRFYASQRDPASSDFVGFANVSGEAGFDGLIGYGGSVIGGLLIEDCWFDWFSGNVLQSPVTTFAPLIDIIIRRNLITNNYSTAGHAQGLYTSRVSLWLEENVFDHNGWYKQGDTNFSDQAEGKATMFNHNTYFTDTRETVFRNNLFLRASSIGTKFTSNTASGINEVKAWDVLVDNNLYVEGEVGISMGGNDDQNNGPRWRNIHVTNNVLTHIGRTQPTLRTLGWGLDAIDWDGGEIKGNLFAHWGDATLNNNFAIHVTGDTDNVSVTDNVIYNIPSGNPLVLFSDGSTQTGTQFTNNDIWTDFAGPLLSYTLTSNAGFGNNTFHSARTAAQWFSINGVYASLDDYKTATGDTTSTASERSYVDSTRTIETYLASTGRPTDMNSFAAELCTQSKFHWVPALGAAAINDYIRAGFATR